jgi:hypothetical protein
MPTKPWKNFGQWMSTRSADIAMMMTSWLAVIATSARKSADSPASVIRDDIELDLEGLDLMHDVPDAGFYP